MIDSSDPQWFFRTICSVPYCWSFFVFPTHGPPQWVTFSKNLYLVSLTHSAFAMIANEILISLFLSPTIWSRSFLYHFHQLVLFKFICKKKPESFNRMCIGIQTKSLHENGCQGYWMTKNCMLCWQIEPATQCLNPKRCFEIDIVYLQPNL